MTWVRQQPWGQHRGSSAWWQSDCGKREIMEAAAAREPVGPIVTALSGSDWLKKLSPMANYPPDEEPIWSEGEWAQQNGNGAK